MEEATENGNFHVQQASVCWMRNFDGRNNTFSVRYAGFVTVTGDIYGSKCDSPRGLHKPLTGNNNDCVFALEIADYFCSVSDHRRRIGNAGRNTK